MKVEITDKKNRHLVITSLTKKDFTRLYQFFCSLSEISKSTFKPHPFSKHFIAKLVADSDSNYHYRLIVCDPARNNKIVGYSFITKPPLFKESGYFGIAIADEYQGSGIGKKLTTETINFAKNVGIKTMYLNVYEDNISALKTYEKQGFSICSQPTLFSKICTLYELWYNESLSDLIKNKPTSAENNTSIWMKHI